MATALRQHGLTEYRRCLAATLREFNAVSEVVTPRTQCSVHLDVFQVAYSASTRLLSVSKQLRISLYKSEIFTSESVSSVIKTIILEQNVGCT